MKKLVAGTIVVLVALALIWMQMREPAAAPIAAKPTAVHVAAAKASTTELAAAAQKVAEVQGKPKKLDPASDEFFYRYDEAVTPALTAPAAKCYTGGLHRVHRNQKVKLGYTLNIKDGVVSVADVTVLESTIADKKLVDCFVHEVAQVTWHDDELPDFQSKNEELLLRPERGMKKFSKENVDYDGDGPIGKLEDPDKNAASSREMPKQQRGLPRE